MNRIASESNSAQNAFPARLFPVLVPVVALALLTGAGQMGRNIMTRPEALSAVMKNPSAPQPLLKSAQYNTTEATFAQYQKVGTLAAQGNDIATLALIDSLGGAPLSADGDSFHQKSMHDFSPVTLMMNLANRLGNQATRAQKSGDYSLAHRYVSALYEIGDRVAGSDSPTFQSVKIAYHYHGLAAQLEADLAAKTGKFPNMMAQYRLTALRALWKARILPRIQADDPGATPTALAFQVSREYRDEWSRIRAGEA